MALKTAAASRTAASIDAKTLESLDFSSFDVTSAWLSIESDGHAFIDFSFEMSDVDSALWEFSGTYYYSPTLCSVSYDGVDLYSTDYSDFLNKVNVRLADRFVNLVDGLELI